MIVTHSFNVLNPDVFLGILRLQISDIIYNTSKIFIRRTDIFKIFLFFQPEWWDTERVFHPTLNRKLILVNWKCCNLRQKTVFYPHSCLYAVSVWDEENSWIKHYVTCMFLCSLSRERERWGRWMVVKWKRQLVCT